MNRFMCVGDVHLFYVHCLLKGPCRRKSILSVDFEGEHQQIIDKVFVQIHIGWRCADNPSRRRLDKLSHQHVLNDIRKTLCSMRVP